MLGHMQDFLHAYWMIRPTHTLSNLTLLFTFDQPALSSFSSFAAAPLFSPSPLQRYSLTCTPPPNTSTLLSPLVPVVPSQTNGAHYSPSKNSRRCHLIYFPPPLSVSLSLLPFPKVPPLFLFFRASPGREMSNGEKACQLIHQLAEPRAALRVGRLRRDCGSEQTVALGCAPVTLAAIWPRRSHGAKGENESVAGVYTGAGEAADVTLGFRPPGLELGRRRWRQKTDGEYQNIYRGAREDDHMGSAASFPGCIYTKIQHCGKKSGIHLFSTRLSRSRGSFIFCGPHRRHCIPSGAALNCTAAAFAELATICTFGAPSEAH